MKITRRLDVPTGSICIAENIEGQKVEFLSLGDYGKEKNIKAEGFDAIVFVPSMEEDRGLITCGNAILSGKLPKVTYKEII